MRVTFSWLEEMFSADLEKPLDIAIPLRNGMTNQPNAYGAPEFLASPVRAGDFTGSLEAGSPVNFFNIAINPHGNGTHTECVGHILKGPYTIGTTLTVTHCIAELITVTPEENDQHRIILQQQIASAVQHEAEALIVRTLPNPEEKKFQKYTGSHPPFFAPETLAWLNENGYLHLLTDLPSVDPEVDGGALLAHKAFWGVPDAIRPFATITELIYVPENIPDGLYLLDLHNLALELDVSPSRPMLYALVRER